MKTSIMHLMGLFLVLAFTASCGKKESGGSSNPANSNNLYQPPGTATVVGSAGHTALVNWLNSPDNAGGMQAFYIKKTDSMGFSINTGLCQMVGINLPGCIKPTSCLVSNNLAVGLGTTTFNNLRPNGCTLSGAFYDKANDLSLREAVVGKTGRHVLIDRTTKNGSIYTVYYSLHSGTQVLSGAAKINTSLPALLNPTLVEENNQRTTTYILPY